MTQAILTQLGSWYQQLWPNVVAAPITAAMAWLFHRFTFHRHAERRHKEMIAAIKDNASGV